MPERRLSCIFGREWADSMSLKSISVEAVPLLRVRGLVKSFGGVTAVNGVDFEIDDGEILALIGPNGSGKSTLFNLIAGALRPSSGQILLRDLSVQNRKPESIARLGIARTFQEATAFPKLTVKQSLAVALRRSGSRIDDPLPDGVAEFLGLSGLQSVYDETAGSLPYGTQKLLGIALAICLSPKLFLLDEPAAGLSRLEAERLMGLIRQLHESGISFGIVDHDMAFVLPLATRVMVLSSGEIIYRGSPAEVVNDPLVREAYLGNA